MKKFILTGTLALFAAGLFAQQTDNSSSGPTSKKGEMYLPEAGDWAIAFDASPWLNYFGNFLSSAGNKAPTANFLTPNNTIVGKYYVDPQTAYRAILRIGVQSLSQSNTIASSTSITGTPPFGPAPYGTTVTDKENFANHFVGLGAGMEKRKGKTRLQGYYGAELMFWLSGSSATYSYGNAYNQTTDPSPLYTNPVLGGLWGSTPTTTNMNSGYGNGRATAWNSGSVFGISALGFIGFEYFFMPKISIGAEYTWGINFQSVGQGSLTTEDINPAAPASTVSDKQIQPGTGTSGFSLDTGINSIFGNNESAFGSLSSADLNIIFHF